MTKLRTGQFWCWRSLHGGDVRYDFAEPIEKPGMFALPHGKVKPYWAPRPGESPPRMGIDLFSHIFGTAPESGEALLLDNRLWVRDCPKQPNAPKVNEGYACGICLTALQFHARIITRKTLEPQGPEPVEEEKP